MLKRCLCVPVVLLAACQTLTPPNTVATWQAREGRILQEATFIARSADRDRERVDATVLPQSTEIASAMRENAALLVTVRAGDSPGQRVVGNRAPAPPRTPGRRWFAKTGISRFINPVDGCVVSPQISIAGDADSIYVTWRAWNVRAGLRMSVQWRHEGDLMHEEDFTLERGWQERCFWFSLTPDLAAFAPGSWSVQLYADGAPLETPQSFTLRQVDRMMDEQP